MVPIWMESVIGDVEFCDLGIGDLDPFVVGAGVRPIRPWGRSLPWWHRSVRPRPSDFEPATPPVLS